MKKVEIKSSKFELKVDTLEELIRFLKEQISPHWITGVTNKKINRKKRLLEQKMIEVDKILVGKYNNHQIVFHAPEIFEQVERLILNLNNSKIGLQEKIQILQESLSFCTIESNYFGSMNTMRFSHGPQSLLMDAEVTDVFPLAMISLNATQWQYIREAVQLRRNLYFEIGMSLSKLYSHLIQQYYSESRYTLVSKSPDYNLMELYLALTKGGKISYKEGNEETFLKDLSILFGVKVEKQVDVTNKILKRESPAKFLEELSEILIKEAKASKELNEKRVARKKKSK